VILLTGFMGAFTTFSSFAFETARQMQTGQWGAAAGNLLLNNVIGIALVFAGFWVGGRV
jgi:CrcB protein